MFDDFDSEMCYECEGYGDDWCVGSDGELHSSCESCPNNLFLEENE